MRVPQVRHRVEHEARRGATGDDRHRHALSRDGVAQQVERAHMRRGDDDSLPALVRSAQHGQIRGGDRHQGDQLLRSQVSQPEQLTEVAGRHAEDTPRHDLQLGPRRCRSHDLADVGDDVRPVHRRHPDPEIPGAVGEPVAQGIRHPGDDPGHDVGDTRGEFVAQFAWPFAPKAVTGATQHAGDRRFERHRRRYTLIVVGHGRAGHGRHRRIIAQSRHPLPGSPVCRLDGYRASRRIPPAARGPA